MTQLHLVAKSCTIYSSRYRRPVRKLFVYILVLPNIVKDDNADLRLQCTEDA